MNNYYKELMEHYEIKENNFPMFDDKERANLFNFSIQTQILAD